MSADVLNRKPKGNSFMRVSYLQHVAFEGLGSIATWAAQRELETVPCRLFLGEPLPSLQKDDLLIIMGGPMGVGDEQEFPWLEDEKRFLKDHIAGGGRAVGVCLGAQLLAECLGARVFPNGEKEIGWYPIKVPAEAESSPFGSVLSRAGQVFHWHGDTFDLPQGAQHLAASAACRNQAFVFENRVLALQFHLETTRESLSQLIENCRNEIRPAPYIQQPAEMLQESPRFSRINELMAGCLDTLVG
jgi:GMP synthase (glutamine-hydrolysing)